MASANIPPLASGAQREKYGDIDEHEWYIRQFELVQLPQLASGSSPLVAIIVSE